MTKMPPHFLPVIVGVYLVLRLYLIYRRRNSTPSTWVKVLSVLMAIAVIVLLFWKAPVRRTMPPAAVPPAPTPVAATPGAQP